MEVNIEIDHNKAKNVLRNRNFLLLFVGKFISMVGDQIYIFSLGWYILSITKSSAKMGILLAIGLLPSVIIGPFAGVIADRFNRKNIMILMDFTRFFIVLVMACLLKNGLLSLWALYICTAILEICGAFFNPSASALIPNIVEENQYTQAASLDQLIWSTCMILGMLSGGLLFGLLGITFIFVINAISFLLSGILELNVIITKPNNRTVQAQVNFFHELAYGYKFFRNNKGLYNIFIYFAFFNFMLYPIGNIYIPFVFNVLLKSSSFQLAIVQASVFIGVFTGSIIMPKFLGKAKFSRMFVLSSLGVVIVELLGSITISPFVLKALDTWTIVVIFLVISIFLGMSITSINIQVAVIFQRKVSDEVRGRVSSLTSALVFGVIPISYLLAGFIANNIPLYLIMFLTSFSILVYVVMLSRLEVIKEL